MMKIFIAVFWIVVLLGFTAQNVTFPSPEIQKIFTLIFVIGCGVLTLLIRPREEGS